MKTFDEIIPEIKAILGQTAGLAKIDKLIINRDLNGRVRLLADEKISDDNKKVLNSIAENLAKVLSDRIPLSEPVMYEPDLDVITNNIPCFPLIGFPNVTIADRLLGESNWGKIAPENQNTHRIVFYSIKGGVGRSTALAVTAWALAEEGKRVLLLDMDLESPGISSSLLSPEKSPMYGIVDWLVEDLINNDSTVFPYIFSLSDLSREGVIFVVPAHGKIPGEYISKIGRVWMPKQKSFGERELWQNRMNRLIQQLEIEHKPDVVLIDSRAGIDEISSACITGFGAESILLFSVDTDQTWTGYKILFDHWLQTGVVDMIRDRLQIVGALIPENKSIDYIDSLCEHSWDIFTEKLYDKVLPEEANIDSFSFDKDDKAAPHFPRIVLWNKSFETLTNMYQSLGSKITREQVRSVYGDLIDYVKEITNG
jgi:hypothetical protein